MLVFPLHFHFIIIISEVDKLNNQIVLETEERLKEKEEMNEKLSTQDEGNHEQLEDLKAYITSNDQKRYFVKVWHCLDVFLIQ